MSQLTDAMNAAIANLKATQSGLTADQVNAIVAQAVAPLTATLTTAVSSEKDDASKIADVQAALNEFTTAFAPATPVAPVADSAPVAPVADSAPAPVADSAPTAPTPDAAPEVAPAPVA